MTNAGKSRFRPIMWATLIPIVAAGSLAFAAPSSAQQRPAADEKKIEQMRKMATAFDANDCRTVLKLGRKLIDARDGSGLPDALEAATYDLVVRCEIQTESDKAYAHLLKGTRLENSSDALWQTRLMFEILAKSNAAAVATVEAMNEGRGAALNGFPTQQLWSFGDALKDAGEKDLRKRFLKVMAGSAYAPRDLSPWSDLYRYAYAERLVDDGETETARAVVATLEDPSQLISASVNSRLRPLLPADLDLRALTEVSLRRNQDKVGRHPDRLEAVVLAATDLRRLGRPQEALTLLQTVAGRPEPAPTFSDEQEQRTWWWDGLAETHIQLGKYEEAVAAYEKGMALNEDGGANVSQTLNLAATHLRFGHADAALKLLADFERPDRSVSPYGEMVMRRVRGCAHALLQRPDDATADLAHMKAHEKDSPAALNGLLLCLNDMDGAAAVMIRRLEDPALQADALLLLSDYADPPVLLPPDPNEARLDALKARPDVRAAIERAGGVRRFPLQF